ncbi:MAG: hypothetical protein ACP6IP_02400 [Candidatus Njordarchaeia archaeon]
MCIKMESKPSKKYVESSFDNNLLIYYKKISDKDPDVLYMKSDEFLYVYCPDGQLIPITTPGYYKVFKKPVDALWIKKVPEQFKIGVPKEATGKGVGFHAIISLHLIDPLIVLQSQKLDSLSKDNVRSTLLNLARQAFESLDLPKDDLDAYRKQFNKKLNELIFVSNLNGFAAATTYIGFSTMCKVEEIEETV